MHTTLSRAVIWKLTERWTILVYRYTQVQMYIGAPMNVAPALSELVEEPGQPISGVPLSLIDGRRNPAMQEP